MTSALDPEPVQELPKSIWQLYWLFARPFRAYVLIQFFMSMMLRGLGQAQFYVTKEIIDTAGRVVPGSAGAWDALFLPFSHVLYVLAAMIMCEWVSWRSSYQGRINVIARARKIVFRYVEQHDSRFFDSTLTGKVAYRASFLPEMVTTLYERVVWDYAPFTIQASVIVFFAYQVKPIYALIVLVWIVSYLCFALLFARQIAKAGAAHSEAKAQLTGRMVDSITNIRNVILFAARKPEAKMVSEAVDTVLTAERRRYVSFIKMRVPVQQGMQVLAFVTFLPLLLKGLASGEVSIGAFFMLNALTFNLVRTLSDLSNNMPETFDMVGSVREAIDTLIVPRTILDKPDASELQVSRGAVHFDKIDFAYDNGTVVFDKLDLAIPAGQRVGLVGISGSGKTTLTSLLLRLYDIQGGQILIDGQAIHDVGQESLRRAIGIIPQDSQLFHRSIMDNIRYGRLYATDDEVFEAAKRAHADAFITALPKGYDTLVGERGIKLSGGQRQRIAIARAILKNAPILILDEATSALDSESEAAIQTAMEDVMQGKTVLAIAHRLSTIAHLDRLIVMEKGRIVEDGTHAELLARGGHYASLWARQSGGFLTETPENAAVSAS